jgi:hypothetical protein
MKRVFIIVLAAGFLVAGCSKNAYVHSTGDTMESERWSRNDKACKERAEKASFGVTGTMRAMQKREKEYDRCLREKGWAVK